LKRGVDHFKPAGAQGCAVTQFGHGVCLTNDEGVTKASKEATRYFKLAADQNAAEVQQRNRISLVTGGIALRNVAEDLRSLKLSVANDSRDNQFIVGSMAENGIAPFTSINFEIAIQHDEQCPSCLPQDPSALDGACKPLGEFSRSKY
jgi:TPR repeat protein